MKLFLSIATSSSVLLLANDAARAFVAPRRTVDVRRHHCGQRPTTSGTSATSPAKRTLHFSKSSNSDWTDLPDEFKSDDGDSDTPKLGIDIGSMLEPLSEQEAAELTAAATEFINDRVAAGIDDLDAVRAEMQRDIAQTRAHLERKSQRKAEQESKKLLTKIDALTSDFMEQSKRARRGTRLAAEADQAAAGQGVDVGSWGSVGGGGGGAVVVPTGLGGSSSSSGSANDNGEIAKQSIVVLADVQADPYAKKLVQALTSELQEVLRQDGDDDDDDMGNDNLQVTVLKPTATVPLAGGDHCAAAILFLTSFSDKSTVANCLDRLLRKTLVAGSLSQPPSQIVCISTVGTERTNKMPYSMANMLGGKLDRRRQMEESVIRLAQSAGADYTICKLGELKASTTEPFQFSPGDAVDGTLDPATAATVLTQAIALQPAARNATFSCVGKLLLAAGPEVAAAAAAANQQDVLDDAFLRLDGPELARLDLAATPRSSSNSNSSDIFGQLVEYLREWAFLLAETGKGLTTPVSAQETTSVVPGVKSQGGVRLLFLPTATGNKYLSKEEERRRESDRGSSSSSSSSTSVSTQSRRTPKDGGIEFSVELTDGGVLRVRAKRCNYGDGSVVKELSEETILSNFRKSMEVWKKDHQQ